MPVETIGDWRTTDRIGERRMNLRFLDKLGSIGAILVAATCAVCFPLLTGVGAAIGLGIFSKYEGMTLYLFQIFVLIALLGNVISYFHHKKRILLALGVANPLLIFFSFYLYFSQFIVYAGLGGLLTAAVLNYLENRKRNACQIKIAKD
jgi:mercuric ion transport protein